MLIFQGLPGRGRSTGSCAGPAGPRRVHFTLRGSGPGQVVDPVHASLNFCPTPYHWEIYRNYYKDPSLH